MAFQIRIPFFGKKNPKKIDTTVRYGVPSIHEASKEISAYEDFLYNAFTKEVVDSTISQNDLPTVQNVLNKLCQNVSNDMTPESIKRTEIFISGFMLNMGRRIPSAIRTAYQSYWGFDKDDILEAQIQILVKVREWSKALIVELNDLAEEGIAAGSPGFNPEDDHAKTIDSLFRRGVFNGTKIGKEIK